MTFTEEDFNYILEETKNNEDILNSGSLSCYMEGNELWSLKEKDNYCCGASKGVIIRPNKDYVIKIPFDIDGDSEYILSQNYCEVEFGYYQIAKKHYPGAEIFLAEVKQIKTPYKTVYIQEKCIIATESGKVIDNGHNDYQEIRDTLKGRNCNCSMGWLKYVYDYSIKNNCLENYEQFLNFLDEEQIGDLHLNNIGFIGDKPVLIDYSGYNEDY